MFSSVDLNLTVQNNVNYPVQINVLGNPYNLLDTSNATTEYRWDFTSFTFTGENEIVIQYKLNSEASFTTYSGQLGSQTLQAIVDVLNNLGIGNFNLYTETGSTYIGTYNDNYTFGQLVVYNSLGIINPLFFVGSGFEGINPTITLRQIRLQSTAKIIAVGGDFLTYQGNPSRNIARLDSNGMFDSSFNPGGTGFDSFCENVIVQSNDKLVCVGQFGNYNSNPTSGYRICGLNSDGTFDATFNIGGSGFSLFAIIWALAVQTDDKVICGGTFTTYNGNAVGGIVRLNSNGSYDNTFNTVGAGFTGGANYMVNTITIQPDGKIICGGDFTTYNGVSKIGLVRLTSTGTNDGTFSNLNAGSICYASALQSDGKILIGGTISSYGVNSVNNIFRLNTNGTFDSSFITGSGFDNAVTNIAIQSDGKIICSGLFSNYDGTQAFGIIRLNSDGSVDTSWDYGFGLDNVGENQPILLQPDGNIVLGGQFNFFDGQPYNRIVGLLS